MKSMAQLIVALSRVIGTRFSAVMIPVIQRNPTLTIPSVYMKNGTQKPKIEISNSMKRWMTQEILKVPWLGLLRSEMKNAVEDQ